MSFMDNLDNWIGPPMHPTDEEIDKSVNKSVFLVIFVVVTFWILMFFIWTIQDAHAGTTFTQLSKSVEIMDMDKWVKERDKAIEYERKVGAMVFCSSETIK